jgi:hypothetical protein
MADRGYGGREGWRGRGSSIFSDDDDDRVRNRDEDRGFLERAGDEVRSWFGDDEAERRRLNDLNRGDARAAFGRTGFAPREDDDAYLLRNPVGGFGQRPEAARWPRERGSERYRGSGDDAWRSRRGEGAQWDDNYLRWREQQIAELDRDYAEYCRERQSRFDDDFGRWRSSRLTEGGAGTSFGEAASAPKSSATTGEPTASAAATRGRGSRTGS